MSPKSKVTSLMLEEVVVTAQKRARTPRTYPFPSRPMSEQTLNAAVLLNAGDLISTLPNMTGFEAPGSRGNLSINCAGPVPAAPATCRSAANASYIDGVYMRTAAGLGPGCAELERVEVLRGPQGTWYGRNATGGAINFITQKPTGEFGGRSPASWVMTASGCQSHGEYRHPG